MLVAWTIPINADTNPTKVWVNDDWAGFAPGTPVKGHTIGIDAFASIQDGINAVSFPGTVYVAQGKYYENVQIPTSPLNEINLIGGYSNNFLINNPYIFKSTVFGDGTRGVISYSGTDGMIKGFEITDGKYGVYLGNLAQVKVVENNIHGNGVGFNADSGSYIIQNNDIHDNSGNGVEFETESAGADIIGNRIYKNGGNGILHSDTTRRLNIQRNFIVDNQGWGMDVNWANNIENNVIARNGSGGIHILRMASVINNTIVNNNGYGISYDLRDSHVTMVNDIIWDNTMDVPDGIPYDSTLTYSCIGTGNKTGEGNISVSPKFLLGDFSIFYCLKPNSPCIDAGTNVGTPIQDILGSRRPLDGNKDKIATTDMGAYEYKPGVIGTIQRLK